jgi:hypothetical protein
MRTIVTHVHLKEGAGRDWDAAMRTRLLAAKKRPGWVGGLARTGRRGTTIRNSQRRANGSTG